MLDDESIVVAGSYTSAAIFGEIGLGAEGMLGDTDMFIAIMNSTVMKAKENRIKEWQCARTKVK